MRGNELLEKMELIDPAYVAAADAPPQRRKTHWLRWGVVAACLCLAIGAGSPSPVRGAATALGP